MIAAEIFIQGADDSVAWDRRNALAWEAGQRRASGCLYIYLHNVAGWKRLQTA